MADRILTPAQVHAGYFELRGATPYHRSYVAIERLPNGWYRVQEPVVDTEEPEEREWRLGWEDYLKRKYPW